MLRWLCRWLGEAVAGEVEDWDRAPGAGGCWELFSWPLTLTPDLDDIVSGFVWVLRLDAPRNQGTGLSGGKGGNWG